MNIYHTETGAKHTDSNGACAHLWEKQFIKMTDDFRQELKSHAEINDITSVKSTIRKYINTLEELYWSI